MTMHSNFWPLDFDQEMEIYDNPSWNLPGRRKKKQVIRKPTASEDLSSR